MEYFPRVLISNYHKQQQQWTSSSPVEGVYCYFQGYVANMTISQELALLPLYNVCSAALLLECTALVLSQLRGYSCKQVPTVS